LGGASHLARALAPPTQEQSCNLFSSSAARQLDLQVAHLAASIVGGARLCFVLCARRASN